eukprot:GHUV01003088.1.p2 GENE.GHUV01003088.1~~GHUV01003088.1.p2  ORF type:complete len:145 (+),score=16.57 GHUV01003088.1:366-800(+)
MALRGLSRHLGPLATSWVRCSSSTPTVFDKMVQIFVIDRSGVRHTVRGLEGNDLAATLHEYGRFKADQFMPNVYDPAFIDCHVYVQGDYLDKIPTIKDEQQNILEQYVRGKTRDNSRMGYFIKLTPQLNGMTVALGDIEPWELQ